MQDLHENHVLVIVASCKNITIIIIIIITFLNVEKVNRIGFIGFSSIALGFKY